MPIGFMVSQIILVNFQVSISCITKLLIPQVYDIITESEETDPHGR